MSLLKLISCNPFVSPCKNSLIVDWRDQSLPQIRSSWTELGQQSLVCYLFFTLFILFISWLDCGFAMHLLLLLVVNFWLLVAIDTCSTHHSLYWCEIWVRIHNTTKTTSKIIKTIFIPLNARNGSTHLVHILKLSIQPDLGQVSFLLHYSSDSKHGTKYYTFRNRKWG